MKLVILGSGTSHGVPVIGCACAVCASANPKDNRLRASLYIEGSNGETAVIDTGPEFRLQALRAGIKKLDAVFLTHEHADHLHGLDDLRPLCGETPLPVFCNSRTMADIRERFSYAFFQTEYRDKPRISLAEAAAPVKVGKLVFTPIPVKHGALDILGWRIDEEGNDAGSAAFQGAVYLTDLSEIPEKSLPAIGSPEILIIGGLRTRPHGTHFTFRQALGEAANIGARQVFLTHVCHDYSHEQIQHYCDAFIEEKKLKGISMSPAWDGLTLTCQASATC
ncbi:MAG: MBL fold metallo-hydrolase [Spirochaetes bacterium]|nr:MBL fold metallo-hydrolase [Spirochaetota bacterium]